ncbi:DUF2157 domain-containing protein [Flavobacterium caseinilyticum]|uniref:DUF2157 domain-containing protein n=1 Tax=Flavobacterium caseinilyticum TaxID=2541732 RepID=A0A4R5AW54_9FLAO|nr:DUF2157 domain-containing protein [Flavobacterium caseinilyticum]TDD77043.1 DUF2157 domain-containing protein [Flavobacterium caseinilyticum]
MKKFESEATQTLLARNLISKEQYLQIQAYRSLNIFSLRNELRFLLYLSVLLFTSGMGTIIYQNIDSIGHIAILSFILVVTIICFYFCFKNAGNFKKNETAFANPIFDYLLLSATILTCTFIGYLQYQYHPFGTHYGLATLIPTLICFFCAYYFDNKSVLSIAITGLAAFVGLSVSPPALLNNTTYNTTSLSYSGILLGIALVLWTIYATKIDLKKHFNLIYFTFSLHLISIACLNNLLEVYWYFFEIILGLSTYYFYRISHKMGSISIFVFTILYAYLGFNFLLFKILEQINPEYLVTPLIFLTPAYLILSIVMFIKLIKNFNKKTSNDSLQ